MAFRPSITENELASQVIRASTHGRTDKVVISSAARYDVGSPTTIIPAGLQIGRITASEKWIECDGTASDGSQIPQAILLEAVDVLPGDDVIASALFHGAVHSVAILADANLTTKVIEGIFFK